MRYKGNDISINTDIYVEDANIYHKLKLDKSIKENMNKQSLYRGLDFKIEKAAPVFIVYRIEKKLLIIGYSLLINRLLVSKHLPKASS